MKKVFRLLIIVIGILSFTSCAMHNGYMVNSTSLSSNNFNYVKKDIKGTAMATYIFGLGGLSKMELVNDAKNDMLSKYPLKENQAIANLTVNWKKTFVLPFAITNKCSVTADIVEFK